MSMATILPVLEAVPLPVLVVDAREKIVATNRGAQALLGQGLEGRPFVTVLRQPALNEALERALIARASDRVRLRLSSPEREMVALVSVAPIELDEAGKVAALLSIEDITATEEAEAMRRDFVANVSHELRTPLTALIGFVETLRGAAKDDPVARDRFLTIMAREAGRMNRLVGDLLSLSRVEAEERRRPTAQVDLANVLRGAIQTLQPVAETAKVQIKREGEPGPLRVTGDADQLTQVFSNLIENAVKYGGAGGEVRVVVEKIAHEPVQRGPAYRVDVIDSGEGIDPIHIPRLTERFYRVDTHRSREQGGTGLGLAIVKHIVARHRGRLKIESEKGKGSRFSVILPAA
ncbi:ATP-binding protein [Sedimentimonas flavescens]|uniref:histidine kinase n=1 Tax=Sedimentimonas flavescens TaxID=2851012 RepID=A0ABT2ZYH7_9RHOB|nr:ATP-binding protein [Sedimentimonas flavescens]MBW0157134.1 PAS domain S-box protein [Sedimentimonas flavescens]MCV2878370.1 ATP-binding protein [Sedimentimonas flavescens]